MNQADHPVERHALAPQVRVLATSPSFSRDVLDVDGMSAERINSLHLAYLLGRPRRDSAPCTWSDFEAQASIALPHQTIDYTRSDWDHLRKVTGFGRPNDTDTIELPSHSGRVDAWQLRSLRDETGSARAPDVESARRARDRLVAILEPAASHRVASQESGPRGFRRELIAGSLRAYGRMVEDILLWWITAEFSTLHHDSAIGWLTKNAERLRVAAERPGERVLDMALYRQHVQSRAAFDADRFRHVFGLRGSSALEIIAAPRDLLTSGKASRHRIPSKFWDSTPSEVAAWHAEEDVVAALALASAAGRLGVEAWFLPTERPFSNEGAWELARWSGLGLGLGYSGYTLDLAKCSGLFMVDVENGTDCLYVRTDPDIEFEDARRLVDLDDIAIIARVPFRLGDSTSVHVLAAGYTAKATEIAGRWLALHWPEIIDRYANAGKNLDEHQLVMLLDVGTRRLDRRTPLPTSVTIVHSVWGAAVVA